MAEDINVVDAVAQQQTEQQNEIAQNMAIALGTELPQTAAAEPVVTEPVNVPITYEVLKDKFGYEKPEDAIAEIEQLRLLKSQPPAPEPIKFENEFNEKLFKAIQSGQIKEVTQLLAQQERLDSLTTSEVTKENAADIIKLNMQLANKLLTKEDIDFQYKQDYLPPKEPVQRASETDEEYQERMDDYNERVTFLEQKRVIAAKMAIPELEKAKSQIKLPEVSNTVDEGYAQYLKMLDEQPKLDAEVSEAYKSFTPKSIETKIPFTDETNKIGFEFQYEPDSETFTKSVGMALDINTFFDSFKKSDGTPDRQRFLEAIHFATNKDRIILEAIKQAKNATLKSQLVDNSQGGGQQRFQPQTQEPSELDKLMQGALGPYTQQRRTE